MHFKSHKLISSNVKRHTKSKRGRTLSCSTTIFSSVYNISICSCLCATETIHQSSGSVGCPPLCSGQSGHNDEGRAGRDASWEINTSGNKMQTQQLLQRNCVCVEVCECDSACEVQLKSPVKKGELKQITFSNKVSVQIYLCVWKGRVRRWCSSHGQQICG